MLLQRIKRVRLNLSLAVELVANDEDFRICFIIILGLWQPILF